MTEHQTITGELMSLRNAVENSGEVIFLTDRDGLITYVNAEFTRLYGYTAGEVVGMTTPRILKSGKINPADYTAFWNKLLNKETTRNEWVNRCKDGRLIDIEGSTGPIFDEQGDIVGFLAVQRDFTQRKQVEEEIKQRNKELAALNAVAAIVSQSLDLSQILHRALDEVLQMKILDEKMYGMLFLLDEPSQALTLAAQRGAPVGHPCLDKPVRIGECVCGLAALRSEVVISKDCLEEPCHTRRWPGMNAHQDICVPLKARGAVLGVMSIRLPGSYPVAEKDIALLESIADQIGVAIENTRLRELRERAIIEERERIARELHDGLSQLLGYVNTKAMAVRLFLHKRQIKAAKQHLLQLEEAAMDVSIDVREAILGLKMASQSDVGLTANLNEFTAQFSRLSGLPVTLTVAPEVECLPLQAETRYQLLRIVQEAMHNVRKHASASQVWVGVQVTTGILEIKVADNGKGFDLQSGHQGQNSSVGLATMRERARSIAAELQIDSDAGHGTCVGVRLAVPGRSSHENTGSG